MQVTSGDRSANMVRSFLLRTLQPDTSAVSACALRRGVSSDHQVVLAACQNRLVEWGWEGDRAAAVRELHSHARLLHACAIPCGPGQVEAVLVVSEEPALPAAQHATNTTAAVEMQQHGRALAAALYARSPSTGELGSCGPVVDLRLSGSGDLSNMQPPRLPQPVFSNVAQLSGQYNQQGQQGHRSVLAVSLYEGAVQLLMVTGGEGGPALEASPHQRLSQLVSAEAGSTVVVEDIAICPNSLPIHTGSLCVAVLYTAYGAGGLGAERSVACLEADASGILKPGPWFIRNVSPATTLLCAVSPSGEASQGREGILLASSTGVIFVPGAAHERHTIPGSMAGTPTCAAALGPTGRLVLGDSQGGLYLVDLQQRRWLGAVQTSAPIAAPSCMAYMPGWSDGGAGVLFLGSQVGSSPTLIEVPKEATDSNVAPAPPALQGVPACVSPSLTLAWEVLPADVSGVDSLAPIRDALLIPDPSGCGDGRLLMSCGTGPSGRLALGRWAADLVSLVSGPEAMPVPVRLFPLRESLAARHHQFLLFGFDADGSTSALGCGGTSFQQAAIPGLLQQETTLACSPMAGGFLLQVTTQGAYAIKLASGEVAGSWPCPVSMAAVLGQYAALASGCSVHIIHVGMTGKLQQERELRFPQQVSALELFELSLAAGDGALAEGTGEVWVAAGQWVSNTVELQHLSGNAPGCHLTLGDKQPRSLAACTLGGTQYLFVGTNSGELLWWEAATAPGLFGATTLQLLPRQWARVGSAPVELQPVRPTLGWASLAQMAPGAPGPWRSAAGNSGSGGSQANPYLLAKSDQLLVVSAAGGRLGAGAAGAGWPHSAAEQQQEPQRLAVRRVHGGQDLAAICPLHTPELPNALAWVDSRGGLHFGRLDMRPALHWDTLPLGATPTLAAYHPPSHCTVVACYEAGRRYSLRLVDLGALVEVARLPMAERHSITALCIASLPCSGAGAGGGAARTALPSGQPGCKDFLLVASCLEGPAAAQPAGGAAAQAGEEAMAATAAAWGGSPDAPWWRAVGGGVLQQASSDVNQAGAASQQQQQAAGAQVQHGLLSMFEIRQMTVSEDSGSSSGGEEGGSGSSSGAGGKPGYELALHGTVPLGTVCYSLAAVVPDPAPFNPTPPATADRQQQEQSSKAPSPTMPMLVAGCDDGLRLYRTYIDDAAVEGLLEVERQLQCIAVAEPLRFEGAGGGAAHTRPAMPASDQRRAGASGGPGCPAITADTAADLASRQIWHQRVALQLICRAPVFSEAIPTSLLAAGSTLFCSELFASLSAWTVRPISAGQLPSLIPLSADQSGSHVGAMLPLSANQALVSFRPLGLALVQRCPKEEAAAHAAARRQYEQVRERGGAFEEGEEDEGDPLLGGGGGWRQQEWGRAREAFLPGWGDCAELEVAAACGLQHPITALCPGELGVEVHAMPSSAPGDAGAPQPSLPTVVGVSQSGGVFGLRLLDEEQLQPLLQLQQSLQAVEQQQALPGVLSHSGRHEPLWRWSPDAGGDSAGGNCVDADFLQAALQSSAAAGSLGAGQVESARQLLQAADVLP